MFAPAPLSIRTRLAAGALVALALTLALPAPSLSAQDPRRLSQELPLGETRWVTLDFPVGELKVVATDDRIVRIDLEISCDAETSDCDKVADKLKIDSRRRGEKLAIEIKGPRGSSSKGVKLRGQVSAPRDVPLSIDMGVGDVDVRGFRHDLYLDLSVGNISVHLPEAVVRTVSLKSGVGDATLRLPGGQIEGSGFVGKGLRWTSGKGSSLIEVEVGVGNVEVTLD